MNNHRPGIGSSRYRQIRVTATLETNGIFSYSVYAKPLNKEWHEQQCLVRGRCEGTSLPLQTSEDVYSALITILEEQMLPHSPWASTWPAPPDEGPQGTP